MLLLDHHCGHLDSRIRVHCCRLGTPSHGTRSRSGESQIPCRCTFASPLTALSIEIDSSFAVVHYGRTGGQIRFLLIEHALTSMKVETGQHCILWPPLYVLAGDPPSLNCTQTLQSMEGVAQSIDPNNVRCRIKVFPIGSRWGSLHKIQNHLP